MELGKVGAGLDVPAIVNALVNADVAPKTNSLNRRESDLNAEMSAVGSLKSALSSLETSMSSLADGTAFDLLSIDAPSEIGVIQTGTPNPGQYSLNVSALATSQVLASGGFTSASAEVGTGTLTIQIGKPTYVSGSSGAYSGFEVDDTKTVSITVDSTNNTVSGLRDAINSSAAGVVASLVVDGSDTRLLLTSKSTGAETAISVVVNDDDGNNSDASGLSTIAYNTSAGFARLTEARSSQDASFSLNGLSLTNSSNTIPDLVQGLEFSLKKVTSGVETVLVQKDTAAIEGKVKSFVDAYNSYQSTLSTLMDHTSVAGALSGDSTARRIQSALRSGVTAQLNLSGNSYTMASDVGITSDRYGKLSLNSAEFQAALSGDSSDLKTFFAGSTITSNLDDNTDASGLMDSLKTTIATYTDTTSGMLIQRESRIESALEDIADARTKLLSRMDSLEERYTKQFTAMDNLVTQLQGTSNFLSNQMDALKAAANR
jgi:flagellar hook-associated protein 2